MTVPQVSIYKIMRRIANETEHSRHEVDMICLRLIDEFKAELAKGNEIYIRHFGFLYVQVSDRAGRPGVFPGRDGPGRDGPVTPIKGGKIVAPRFRATLDFRRLLRTQLAPLETSRVRGPKEQARTPSNRAPRGGSDVQQP